MPGRSTSNEANRPKSWGMSAWLRTWGIEARADRAAGRRSGLQDVELDAGAVDQQRGAQAEILGDERVVADVGHRSEGGSGGGAEIGFAGRGTRCRGGRPATRRTGRTAGGGARGCGRGASKRGRIGRRGGDRVCRTWNSMPGRSTSNEANRSN